VNKRFEGGGRGTGSHHRDIQVNSNHCFDDGDNSLTVNQRGPVIGPSYPTNDLPKPEVTLIALSRLFSRLTSVEYLNIEAARTFPHIFKFYLLSSPLSFIRAFTHDPYAL